jgi:hypothetical protein
LYPLRGPILRLRGFAGADLVSDRGVDFELADGEFGVKDGSKSFLHFRVLRAIILLRILPCVSKA